MLYHPHYLASLITLYYVTYDLFKFMYVWMCVCTYDDCILLYLCLLIEFPLEIRSRDIASSDRIHRVVTEQQK